jgi:hypothetical protein
VRRIDHAQILQAAGGFDVRQKAVKELPLTLAVEDNHRHPARAKAPRQSCAMMFSRNVDLPAPVPPTMTPCFIRTVSGQSHGSLWTLYPSSVAPLWLRIANHLRILGCLNNDCGVRPVLLSLLPAANQLRNNEAAAKEQDGARQEDFKALVIAQMEARHGDIPAESERRRSE